MGMGIIILAGAPAASSLDSASCTLDAFTHPFFRYLKSSPPIPSASAPSSRDATAWRSLPLKRQALPTSFLFGHADAASWSRPHFFTTADVSREDASEDATALTQFCDESLAALGEDPTESSASQSFETTDTSFVSTSTVTDTSVVPPPAVPAHLSDLDDIPPAPTVLGFASQTITLSLVVGVLSVAQPRAVTTRWGKTLALVELLVGDDTASGFGVTFWLPADGSVPMTATASAEPTAVRRQDVILLRNVALRVFRGKVYGQSLRGGLTKLSLLWRRDGSGHYSYRDLRSRRTQGVPQLEKTRLVKDWLLKFIGPSRTTARGKAVRTWDDPPDDTQ
jgi:hypothetical protein